MTAGEIEALDRLCCALDEERIDTTVRMESWAAGCGFVLPIPFSRPHGAVQLSAGVESAEVSPLPMEQGSSPAPAGGHAPAGLPLCVWCLVERRQVADIRGEHVLEPCTRHSSRSAGAAPPYPKGRWT